MEKTRHYLLLREKLEATLQAGQDALYKGSDISDFTKSPVLSHSPSSSPAPDSPNQRQRELAAKVTAGLLGLQNICLTMMFPFLDLKQVLFHFVLKMSHFSSLQCLRLLMHTFNREYSQVSSSASESKVSPSLGPLTRPVSPSEPSVFTTKYLSPALQPISAISVSHYSIALQRSIFLRSISPSNALCFLTLYAWVKYIDSGLLLQSPCSLNQSSFPSTFTHPHPSLDSAWLPLT